MMEKLRKDGLVVDAEDGTQHKAKSPIIPRNLSMDNHHAGIDGLPGNTNVPATYGDTARELAAFKHGIGNAENAQLDPDTFKKLVTDYQRAEGLQTQNGELTRETRDRILQEEHAYKAGGMKVSDKVTLDQSLAGDKDPLPSGSLEQGSTRTNASPPGFTYSRRSDSETPDGGERRPAVVPDKESGSGLHLPSLPSAKDVENFFGDALDKMRQQLQGAEQTGGDAVRKKISYTPNGAQPGDLVSPDQGLRQNKGPDVQIT